METPQYLLKLIQRLLVAGHQLSLTTFFFGPTPITKQSQHPPFGVFAHSLFSFSWDETAQGQRGDRERQSEKTKFAILGSCRGTCWFHF